MKPSKDQIELFKEKALDWAAQFDVFIMLDNNFSENAFQIHDYEFMLAAGVKRELKCEVGNAFEELKKFVAYPSAPFQKGEAEASPLNEIQNKDVTFQNGEAEPKPFDELQNNKTGAYPSTPFQKREAKPSPGFGVFGYFSYDLKNEIEKLKSLRPKGIDFPDLYFFEPNYFISIDKNGNIFGNENLIEEIKTHQLTNSPTHHFTHSPSLQHRVSKDEYIKNVNHIRQHIIEGDVYEMNYCIEFFSENISIDPVSVYKKLNKNSPTPFGAFFKLHDQFLICASPERFMKKKNAKLFSQPIKGTVKRGTDKDEDEILKQQLLNSEKERAENLMIVDLVRNDLARSSKTGTVKVDELFGIYSFKQVHQMISTVSSEIKDEIHPVDAIKNAFPMGSMTGAPKIMAMELIEKYEQTKRGLYSGAVGYITSSGDFDLNVVIRSIQFNVSKKYLSYEVGSAITFDSDAESEYQECLWKAQAIVESLKDN